MEGGWCSGITASASCACLHSSLCRHTLQLLPPPLSARVNEVTARSHSIFQDVRSPSAHKLIALHTTPRRNPLTTDWVYLCQ